MKINSLSYFILAVYGVLFSSCAIGKGIFQDIILIGKVTDSCQTPLDSVDVTLYSHHRLGASMRQTTDSLRICNAVALMAAILQDFQEKSSQTPDFKKITQLSLQCRTDSTGTFSITLKEQQLQRFLGNKPFSAQEIITHDSYILKVEKDGYITQYILWHPYCNKTTEALNSITLMRHTSS